MHYIPLYDLEMSTALGKFYMYVFNNLPKLLHYNLQLNASNIKKTVTSYSNFEPVPHMNN